MIATLSLDHGLSVLFALLTAVTNATALIAQHLASARSTPESKWKLFLFLVRQPLWIFGWIALIGSLVFQALALHFGPMSEVQPLLVSELIVALILRQLWLGQSITIVAWLSAALTIAGLVSFLLASSPTSNVVSPATSHWVLPVSFCVLAILALSLATRGASPARSAALFAGATGVAWALEATFIKATTQTFSVSGLSGTVSDWPLYAFIVMGIVGLLAEQAAIHVGPLRVSQPFIVIVDPVVSVVLGVAIFGEHLLGGTTHVLVATSGFVAMILGVVAVTRSVPANMKAELHRL